MIHRTQRSRHSQSRVVNVIESFTLKRLNLLHEMLTAAKRVEFLGGPNETARDYRRAIRSTGWLMSGPPVDTGIRLLDDRIQNCNFQSPRENSSLRTQGLSASIEREGQFMDCKRTRVLVPAPVEAPRGAEWAAGTVVWILRAAKRGARLLRRPARAPGKGDQVNRGLIPHRSSGGVAAHPARTTVVSSTSRWIRARG